MPALHRTLAAVPLALALALPAPASLAQAFFVPMPASVALAPLLVFLPLAMLSRTDKSRIRAMEARSDWAGLADLASRRLARTPGDVAWLEVRGHALQRLGRCKEAIPDLQSALETHLAGAGAARGGYSAGLALGMCQMAGQDLGAAAATFERLEQVEALHPEPLYNLGVIRTIQGDTHAAAAALAALEPRSASLAASLRAYIAASTGSPAVPASPGPEPTVAAPAPGPRMTSNALEIGSRSLQLPPAEWYSASRSQSTVRGSKAGGQAPTSRNDLVPMETLRAWGLDAQGKLVAAVEFSANPRQSHGTVYWNADDGCAGPNALHTHRFRGFDQPECVQVRMVAPAGESRWTDVSRTLAGSMPSLAYEVHYERYGIGWAVNATFLLPAARTAGDLATVQWAHALAAQLRPLASSVGAVAAVTPAWAGPGR